jgi:hypothetical protein
VRQKSVIPGVNNHMSQKNKHEVLAKHSREKLATAIEHSAKGATLIPARRGSPGVARRGKPITRKEIMKHDVYDNESTATATADRARAGDKSASGKPGADKEEMMKKAEAAGTPGPGHKALEALVGNWKAEVKCWHEPGGSPQVSQGTAKTNWTLNGRFLQEDFHGEMMGKPFRGLYLTGYDNTKQTFNSVWISDMQTSMFVAEGKGENGNKTITQEGRTSCGATGQTNVPMKTVLRVISNDKHTFEMFDASKGENAKVMEITYTRQ